EAGLDGGRLVDRLAVLPRLVAAEVGADVEVLAERRQARVARRGCGEQRARLRVELAEAQEIAGQRARQDCQVALHVTGGEPGGRAEVLVAADHQPGPVGRLRNGAGGAEGPGGPASCPGS